ncbi:protoporphyrinogen oxidase [Verruconis gallopava]|uniref:Protoporphyrinogen oxidase n=1 Tax=Verruconis gallopava TaxID=253628 RepID=A0A0D2A9A1_9PEZI|nr:protoporphyrinogen oxidase [Verruconis gallopava]KIW03155.1 protoporphyrinogen oxidase [Verruconis gallopava]
MRFSSSVCRFHNAVIHPPQRGLRSHLLSHRQLSRRSSYATASTSSSVSPDAKSPAGNTKATDLGSPDQHVAILGGGITALSAAYYLLRTPQPPKITIYEKSPRIGGWLQSKYVDLPGGGGSVLFEAGPRNVRPVIPLGFATVALWENIGLEANMIVTPKDSIAAKRRWLYYPDHLVELPSPSRGLLANLWTILTEPAFKGYMRDLMYEMSVPPRGADVEDESVGEFISRRVNRRLVDQVASAVLHGIYAGDAWELSARSVLSDAWWAERHSGSVFKGVMDMQREGWMRRRHAELLEHLTRSQQPSEDVIRTVKDASTVTLDGGLEMFADRLRHWLETIGNVEFKTKTEVKTVKMADGGDGIELTTSSVPTPQRYDQIISTIPSKTLSYITLSENNPDSLSSLAQTPTVSVNVVNLFYTQPNLLPISGFGYLIPQATPLENNPELALGVVFDSDVVPLGQDKLEVLDTSRPEQPRGTKITVMLGGHWYNAFDSIPDKELALQHAKSVVKRHLGIKAEPAVTMVNQQHDCIPQYTVGHTRRLRSAHSELLRRFGGRLKVAGSSYGGVGINDCVVAGMEIAGLAAGKKENWQNKTGLEWAESGADMDYIRGPAYFAERGIGGFAAAGSGPQN